MRRVICWVAILLGCGQVPDAVRVGPPNIVLVMTDDQGYGDLGIHGNPVLDTPHIDSIAREGVTIESFYVSPICTATRASLMTGRYHYRTRAIDTWRGHAMMDPEEHTIAESLREAGYATGIFGKWHLGDSYPMRAMDQGFDESLVHRGGGLNQPSEPPENAGRYTNAVLLHNGEQTQTRGYITDVLFDAALDWIESAHEARRPFFAYVSTNAPHGPFHDVPDDLYQKYRSRDLTAVSSGDAEKLDQLARIYAMVENIDENVGRLLRKLESLQIAEDTIVIFMSDNGPNFHRHPAAMRGEKGSVLEGGIRTPFFVRWPGHFAAGHEVLRVAAHIDVMPTLLDVAGIGETEDLRLDGRSLLPLLESKRPLEGVASEWSNRKLMFQSHRGERPVRYRNFAVRGPRWKLVRPSGHKRQVEATGFELYDMATDPQERNDVADQWPELVSALKADYDQWFDDVSATRPRNFAAPRIVIGTDHETTTVLTKQDWAPTHGERWGVQGRWHLRVANEGRFDVQVRLQQAAAGEATLRIGDTVARLSLTAAVTTIEFDDLQLPAGNADLEFALRDGGHQLGPYQVTLKRK